jgi:ParB family transcriptional regulator, chromosome partitioning protein
MKNENKKEKNTMTSAVVVKEVPAVAPNALLAQDILLSRIEESKTNPRREFDEIKLAELSSNIRQHGVLQPVLVRPLPGGEAGYYELVAGARRFRASRLAGRESIPATIRELTDAECLELQLIENLQRADVHELDEARGYAALMQIEPEVYTIETLAEKIGRSEKYIYSRLRLMHLVEEIQQAFYNGKFSVAHAFEIARLEPEDQRRAFAECFPNHRSVAAAVKDKRSEAISVRQLRDWIAREIHLDLANAPFDLHDEQLVLSAGSCAKCPKRTGNNPLLFPDVRRKSICSDPACYRGKVEALVQIRVRPLAAAGEDPLRVSHTPPWQVRNRDSEVLYDGQFRTVGKAAECPHTQSAVVVDGEGAGRLVHVCREEKCPVHSAVTRFHLSPQQRAARSKEALAERVEKQTRLETLHAVRGKLPPAVSRPDLEMAVLDYFERLGHDNHRRLCHAYGWDETKKKTVPSSSLDYISIAAKAVREMSTPDVQRFLIVCALVSDLYCPGYNPGQALAKDSKLARTAVRYKVDIPKIAVRVRSELSAKKKGAESPRKNDLAANRK